MRDVIVIGAGGGGPVVAKELAGRGLDVLLLEGGARHADPEREWTDHSGLPASIQACLYQGSANSLGDLHYRAHVQPGAFGSREKVAAFFVPVL